MSNFFFSRGGASHREGSVGCVHIQLNFIPRVAGELGDRGDSVKIEGNSLGDFGQIVVANTPVLERMRSFLTTHLQSFSIQWKGSQWSEVHMGGELVGSRPARAREGAVHLRGVSHLGQIVKTQQLATTKT